MRNARLDAGNDGSMAGSSVWDPNRGCAVSRHSDDTPLYGTVTIDPILPDSEGRSRGDGRTGRVVEPGIGQAGLERARAEFSRAAFEARWRDMISRHLLAQNALLAAKGGSPLGEE